MEVCYLSFGRDPGLESDMRLEEDGRTLSLEFGCLNVEDGGIGGDDTL